MKPSLHTSSQKAARLNVLHTLGFAEQAMQPAVGPMLYAEIVRTVLWAHWRSQEKPVYSTRLIHAVMRSLLPWHCNDDSQDEIKQRLDETLLELAIIGDIASLPGGYWIPTPLRIVNLPDAKHWLVLGGMPTHLLPSSLHAVLEHNGTARFLTSLPDEQKPDIDHQPYQEWLRTPDQAIDQWTSTVLDTVVLNPAGEISIDVYAPAKARGGSYQYERWTKQIGKLSSGRYLARIVRRRNSPAYMIAQIDNGRPVALGVPDLGEGDIRRLMYGLDRHAHNPVRIMAKRHSTYWTLTLRSALPYAEHRLLLALGTLRTRDDGKYYPRWWDVPVRYFSQVYRALIDLGAAVDKR